MSSLFIIGNGFDIAHKMETGFNQFREYLSENYSKSFADMLYVPDSITGHHGEELQSDDEVVGLMTYLLNEVAPYDELNQESNWNTIEELLGKLNLQNCFFNVEPQYDKEGDRNYSWEFNTAESICGNMALAMPRITEFLSDWIHTIEIPNLPLKQFTELFNPDEDLFLTFNYTQTLEKLYGCPEENTCHIHGMASTDPFLQIDKLILGHCGQADYLHDDKVPYDMGKSLQDIYESLRKNTKEQVFLHQDFFEKVRNTSINRIYSYGFSFADVDLPYIKKLCNMMSTNKITWLLNTYDNVSKRKENKKKLRECGFQGDFREFNV